MIVEVARVLASSKNAIAFTGAGISAESGVPTFRGKDGLWNKYRPEELATPEAFARNPKLVWEFYKWRINKILKAKPNPAHYALVELEDMGILRAVITQNVDDLHREAGTRNLIELHGNIFRVKCTKCNFKEYLKESQRLEEVLKEDLPKCPRCGSLLRPDVVWFGEPLPREELDRAFKLAEKADAVLVVGTSGLVYPAAYIPYIVKESGGTVIEVNVEESAITPIADFFLRGRAGEVLPRVVHEVRRLLQ
ncbi:NAD-dependent protein deacetylase [Pyrococcus abyssi]|uniref:NAD-dependent protein deacylase n=1 Tax=Pyrococcus abyssi (strain GE5 / Orsay) TaxID=272844 RepID=NPD_PYRAB|nr:NAD-dependent protein deacetylase [Pyrococcus abyssi]Q9UZE7.1 RecName: Full=NAD-dependent protein deacylase; AltName: Full=Regulatory protein SIR2 homolog [Pyrococcus abyssi GE5]CAB50112.1 NAD-dependent protein deacetylase [Pyrococcus abyssi GE5]CCE70636.1 TPA: NAD-dependent deacetylase [Pyrococcus abyssi GE5]